MTAQDTAIAIAAPAVPSPTLLPLDRLDEIEGWFFPADHLVFDWLLSRGRAEGQRGDLLELGVYQGKSAVFIGAYAAPDEEFTVCDLFDSPAPDDSTAAEMQAYYATLTRRAFEANYLRFHPRLPTVVQGPSSAITAHVAPGSCRFVHIDASHLYEHVRGDIAAARSLLAPDGIVALDDFRSPHTPGVAAATWEAVFAAGLKPVALTESTFYGTWGDPTPVRTALTAHLATHPVFWAVEESVASHTLIHIHNR